MLTLDDSKGKKRKIVVRAAEREIYDGMEGYSCVILRAGNNGLQSARNYAKLGG